MKMNIKKGISLIVLVITIIVMIILAATIIISLTNNGIVNNANKAVVDTELAQVRVMAETAWSDAYVEGKRTPEELRTAVTEALNANKIDENKYIITVTDKGTTVEKIGNVEDPYADWEIGRVLTAEEYKLTGVRTSTTSGVENNGTAQTFTTSAGELEGLIWIYIGKDSDGNHLITTSEPQQPGTKDFRLYGGNGWLDIKNGTNANPSQLDKVCKELYGKDGAQKVARSMKIEDVERILGYTGEKAAYYGEGGSYTPITDGENKISELETKQGRPFMSENKKTPTSPNATDANFGDIRSDYYYINITEDVGEIANSSNAGLIFKSTGYWIASSCVSVDFDIDWACFGVRCAHSNGVSANDLFGSADSGMWDNSFAVRPVVSI